MRAFAWCPRGSPDSGDCNSGRHRWNRSRSCKRKVNLKAIAKESQFKDHCQRRYQPGEAAHCTKPPGGNVGLWQLDSQVGHLSQKSNFRFHRFFLTHLSLLLPCFLLQQLRKVLSKPLLVIFHCTRLQQFEELSKDRDGSNNNNLSLGFPMTMFLILLEQTQGLLAHDKVSMGVVAVVILNSEWSHRKEIFTPVPGFPRLF